MAVVTKYNVHIADKLIAELDFAIKRQQKKWDNCLIIDGDEGSGKTTLSWGIGAYWADKIGKDFGIDNIFFDPNEMMRFATRTREQIIIWDEAAIAGLSIMHQNKLQKKLIQIMMTARSRQHLWVFNIPKFYKLNEYIAIDRSIALIHVYSPDNISRGQFVFLGKKKKEMVYWIFKGSHKKRYDIHDFSSRFPKNYESIIDNDLYEKKKGKAIAKIFDGDDGYDKNTKKLILLQNQIANSFPELNTTKLSEKLGIPRTTLNLWKSWPEKHPFIFENQENDGVTDND